MTTESLVCSLSNSDWRTNVSTARTSAVKAMPISKRNEPAVGMLDQNVVDEDLGKSGGDDRRHHQREADDDQQADGGLRGAQFAQQQPQALRLAAGPLERSGRLHRQRDAGEREIELGHVGSPASDRRIVDVDVVAVDAFQHHEMVEVPVDDAGHRQFVQRRGLLAKTLGVEAEAARRPDDVARLAAVARDAAGDAELLQRDPGAVVGEHHGERRRPALDGFHLQDGGRLLDVPAPEQPSDPLPK